MTYGDNDDAEDHEFDLLDVLPRELAALIGSASIAASSMPAVGGANNDIRDEWVLTELRRRRGGDVLRQVDIEIQQLGGTVRRAPRMLSRHESFGWDCDACMNISR